jgi:Protein of unknown function (DUF1585)
MRRTMIGRSKSAYPLILSGLACLSSCYSRDNSVGPSGGASSDAATSEDGGTTQPIKPRGPATDPLSPTRLLRRLHLALTDLPPTAADYDEMQAAPTEAAKEAVFQAHVEKLLASPAFYRTMVDFGHNWFRNADISPEGGNNEKFTFDGDGRVILDGCEPTSKHPGAYRANIWGGADKELGELCNDAGALVNMIEPWWAPGTKIAVLGRAGTGVTTDPEHGFPDCAKFTESQYGWSLLGDSKCSCGPNLIYCRPTGHSTDDPTHVQRQGWDEAARLLGHVVWHDKPLSDLVLANYSVGPVDLQGWYVGMARQALGKYTYLDADDSWWRPAKLSGLRDPDHDEKDPLAWREFVVETRNPMMLSLAGKQASGDINRTYHYDPRTESTGQKGIPAAGVLTSVGANASFTRERVRAARWLENFACQEFVPPPAGATFNAFDRDPGREGSCQYCHTAIDPAAIHFKRFGFDYQRPTLLGITHPFDYHPDKPMGRLDFDLQHDTLMTPATEAQIAKSKDAALIDFLPPDSSLFGQVSDGTNGPLGFGKMLVKSGVFDKCAARKLFAHVVGRELNPEKENAYIDSLSKNLTQNKRSTKSFIRYLVNTREFRRGL